MPFNERPDGRNVVIIDILHEEHGVRIAHRDHCRTGEPGIVDRSDFHINSANVHFLGKRNVLPSHQGRAHIHGDLAILCGKCFQNIRFGLDGHPVLAGFSQ